MTAEGYAKTPRLGALPCARCAAPRAAARAPGGPDAMEKLIGLHPFFHKNWKRKVLSVFKRPCPWVPTGLRASPLPLACSAARLMLARPATALALPADCACRAHPRVSGDLDIALKVDSSPTPCSSGADSSSAVMTTCRLRLSLSRRYVRLRCLANPSPTAALALPLRAATAFLLSVRPLAPRIALGVPGPTP